MAVVVKYADNLVRVRERCLSSRGDVELRPKRCFTLRTTPTRFPVFLCARHSSSCFLLVCSVLSLPGEVLCDKHFHRPLVFRLYCFPWQDGVTGVRLWDASGEHRHLSHTFVYVMCDTAPQRSPLFAVDLAHLALLIIEAVRHFSRTHPRAAYSPVLKSTPAATLSIGLARLSEGSCKDSATACSFSTSTFSEIWCASGRSLPHVLIWSLIVLAPAPSPWNGKETGYMTPLDHRCSSRPRSLTATLFFPRACQGDGRDVCVQHKTRGADGARRTGSRALDGEHGYGGRNRPTNRA